jgi:hypothetical protein
VWCQNAESHRIQGFQSCPLKGLKEREKRKGFKNRFFFVVLKNKPQTQYNPGTQHAGA